MKKSTNRSTAPPLPLQSSLTSSNICRHNNSTDTGSYGATYQTGLDTNTPSVHYAPAVQQTPAANRTSSLSNSNTQCENADDRTLYIGGIGNPILDIVSLEPEPDYPREGTRGLSRYSSSNPTRVLTSAKPSPSRSHATPTKRPQVGLTGVGMAYRNLGYDDSSDQGSAKNEYFYNL